MTKAKINERDNALTYAIIEEIFKLVEPTEDWTPLENNAYLRLNYWLTDRKDFVMMLGYTELLLTKLSEADRNYVRNVALNKVLPVLEPGKIDLYHRPQQGTKLTALQKLKQEALTKFKHKYRKQFTLSDIQEHYTSEDVRDVILAAHSFDFPTQLNFKQVRAGTKAFWKLVIEYCRND